MLVSVWRGSTATEAGHWKRSRRRSACHCQHLQRGFGGQDTAVELRRARHDPHGPCSCTARHLHSRMVRPPAAPPGPAAAAEVPAVSWLLQLRRSSIRTCGCNCASTAAVAASTAAATASAPATMSSTAAATAAAQTAAAPVTSTVMSATAPAAAAAATTPASAAPAAIARLAAPGSSRTTRDINTGAAENTRIGPALPTAMELPWLAAPHLQVQACGLLPVPAPFQALPPAV